jgi:hypothetical protein
MNGHRDDHREENLATLCADCHARLEFFIGRALSGLAGGALCAA